MTRFIKFCSILAMCIVTLLIFVNVVERSVDKGKVDKSLDRLHSKKDDKGLLDLENFQYIIRPSTCSSTFLTWIVTSYAGDPAPRSALRRAYPKEELLELGITRVFLLGRLDDARAKQSGVPQASLRNEAERFDDIVQGNFYEAYRNLTYKHLMGLKWASESCDNSSHVLKQDDDIIVNLYEIIEKLKVLRVKKEIFAGYVLRGMKAVREPANKWYVRQDEFDKNVYPDFLSGWLYIIDRDSASKLVRHSRACKKYFWIDDVFLTGILRHELNIPLIDWHDFYTTDYRYLICCLRGKEKNLNCEFAVGPNGGKIELQVDFQRFAAFCRNHNCTKRNVGKTCVVEYEKDKVQMGSAKIEPVIFL